MNIGPTELIIILIPIGGIALLITVLVSLMRRPSRDGDFVGASTSPLIAAAPGWHPDPASRHSQRYWDGSTWTPHVSDNGVASMDPV